MTLINLIVVLILLGGAIYLLTLIPIDEGIKAIIRVILILAAVLYVVIMFVAPLLRGQGIGL